MDDLVGVTLEFGEGSDISDKITRMYMAAPDMYKLLDDIVGMEANGEASLPGHVLSKIMKVLSLDSSPEILEGHFE